MQKQKQNKNNNSINYTTHGVRINCESTSVNLQSASAQLTTAIDFKTLLDCYDDN